MGLTGCCTDTLAAAGKVGFFCGGGELITGAGFLGGSLVTALTSFTGLLALKFGVGRREGFDY
jgi:hypothetical protein